MGESKKLATGKDPPDQASAVKCSTPKPRRQKKTGTAPFVLGPLIRNARIILQSTSSVRCCPPYWHISRTGGPPGGWCRTQPTVSGYSSTGLSQPTSILKTTSRDFLQVGYTSILIHILYIHRIVV